MVARPDSIPEARRAFREARDRLKPEDGRPFCEGRPVPFTDVRATPAEAAELCGRGTDHPCPLLRVCEPLGFTESVYADDMVYGGLTWRKGLPLVSETAYQAKRAKTELKKLPKNGITVDVPRETSTYA